MFPRIIRFFFFMSFFIFFLPSLMAEQKSLLPSLPSSSSSSPSSSSPLSAPTPLEDFVLSLSLIAHGAYEQFLYPTSWALMGLGAMGNAYYMGHSQRHDKRILAHWSRKKVHSVVKSVGDEGSILLSFPLLPLASYFAGRYTKNTKLRRFALETFSAMYLALGEAALLSAFPLHSRPSGAKTTFFEKKFRGSSSFPSGHIIPASILTFKTLQFFGPLYALIPLSFTVMTFIERIHSRKHFPSDTFFGIILAGLGSIGVSKAAEKNPLYHFQWEKKEKTKKNKGTKKDKKTALHFVPGIELSYLSFSYRF